MSRPITTVTVCFATRVCHLESRTIGKPLFAPPGTRRKLPPTFYFVAGILTFSRLRKKIAFLKETDFCFSSLKTAFLDSWVINFLQKFRAVIRNLKSHNSRLAFAGSWRDGCKVISLPFGFIPTGWKNPHLCFSFKWVKNLAYRTQGNKCIRGIRQLKF